MKLTHSLVALATLTTLGFAGGDINPVTVFEEEAIVVPVEPVIEPVPEPIAVPAPAPEPVPVPVPAPKPDPVPVVVAKPSGIYIAGGLTDVAVRLDDRANLFSEKLGQDRQLGLTGRLGYDFMDYLGAELRGTYGVAKDDWEKFKQIGAYLKPNYDIPNVDGLNLYGLLGLSKTSPGVDSETGFSYGAGLDYKIPGNDNVSVFTDVLNYMKKSDTSSQWGLTLGAAYRF